VGGVRGREREECRLWGREEERREEYLSERKREQRKCLS